MDAQIDGNDASMTEAISKAMYDRELTSSEIRTRVGKAFRNGKQLSCVGEDQDDFGSVEQASISSAYGLFV